MTKKLLVLLMLVVPLVADDKAELLKKAAELEKQATALLNDGKRQAAFDLLAKAAELRDKARRGAAEQPKKAKQDPKKAKKPAPVPDPVGKPQVTGKGKRNLKSFPATVDAQLKRFDAALAKNDMAGVRKAAEATRQTLKRWNDALRKREKRAGQASQQKVLKRVQALEREVDELRKMLTR
ncbi:MAG: hypothetical protein ACYTGN_03515 [Planctomycetota bacterium]|jgi:hypothetical protein